MSNLSGSHPLLSSNFIYVCPPLPYNALRSGPLPVTDEGACACVFVLLDFRMWRLTVLPRFLFRSSPLWLTSGISSMGKGREWDERAPSSHKSCSNYQQSITSLTSSGQSRVCFIVVSLLTLEQMMVDWSHGLKPGRHFALIKQGENDT